jgi:hypothetical protein
MGGKGDQVRSDSEEKNVVLEVPFKDLFQAGDVTRGGIKQSFLRIG